MLVKILVNNTNNSNGYIKGTIELNLLKEALEKNVITENSYYYLKDKIITELTYQLENISVGLGD